MLNLKVALIPTPDLLLQEGGRGEDGGKEDARVPESTQSEEMEQVPPPPKPAPSETAKHFDY